MEKINGVAYYQVEELAETLKVNYWTVLRWIRAKTLEGHKVGKRYLIPKSAVDKYIESH